MRKGAGTRICGLMLASGLVTVAASGLIAVLAPCGGRLKLRNNLDDCGEPTKNSILAARAKWSFEVDCYKGRVTCVSAGKKSPTIKKWPTFVKENAGLFGVNPSDLASESWWRTPAPVVQLWKGVPIDLPHVGGWTRESGDNLVIPVRFIKTDSWNLQLEPKITKMMAIGIALEHWGWPLPIKKAQLTIRVGSIWDSCGSPSSPTLAWSVEGYPFFGARYPHCGIDAQTGSICGECDKGYVFREY